MRELAQRVWGRLAATSILAGAAAIGLLIAYSGIGDGPERALQSIRDAARARPASGDFVLVEIDPKSLQALDQWPWPRRLHAEAIERLQAAGAGAVAFDVDFSSRSVPAEDDRLASSIGNARVPIILPTFRQMGHGRDARAFENAPLPAFRAHAQLAAVNIFADADGLVRRYPYGVVTRGVPRPSIGAAIAGAAGSVGRDFPIDGAIDPDTIPRISFVDVVEGRLRPGALEGKVALIGATAIELGDRYPVPRHGVLPGPVIQLLGAETLHAGSAPVSRGGVLPIVLAVLAVWLCARAGRARGIAIGLAAAAALLLLPFALEANGLGTLEIAGALAALLFGAGALALRAAARSIRLARTVDKATGLLNRRGFEESAPPAAAWGVVALRLENYLAVAGVMGQIQARELVLRVCERLAVAGVRQIYRIDEGALMWFSQGADETECAEQVEAVSAHLRAPIEVGGRFFDLRGALGLAAIGAKGHVPAADHACLAAAHALERQKGWAMYTAALDEERGWELALAGELNQAMADGDIWVAYQPKLRLADGSVCAAEALVRWRHPRRGAISPDDFIPALEQTGRILDLTLYVLRKVAAAATGWASEGAALNVAVNVSAVLMTDPAFLAAVRRMFEDGTLPASLLTIEVTESATFADPDRAALAMEELARMGLRLSIDDYGTGQSTLSYLKRLPAREVKIDKSFVLALDSNRSDQAMVRSTIELAHALGFTVVAEGVENAEILSLLTAMGCDYAQGWHIGKPVPAEDLAAHVRSWPAAA